MNTVMPSRSMGATKDTGTTDLRKGAVPAWPVLSVAARVPSTDKDGQVTVTTTAAGSPGRSWLTPILGGLTTLTSMIVIIGATVVLFFNPLWITFEQGHSAVPSITGYTSEQVRITTGSILADLILGPPDFDVAVHGQPVLDREERSHMVDVRNVLLPFGALLAIATLTFSVLVVANRRTRWLWRAVGRGSEALALVGIVVGAAALFFFDSAFLLFHRVFFPQGNFSFDPRTERLTQLFPDQFWSETLILIAIVGMAVATAVTVAARRLEKREA